MAISVEQVLAFIQQAIQGDEPEIDRDGLDARVKDLLRSVLAQVDRQPQLSAFEADLFRLPQNSFLEILNELHATEDDIKDFKRLEAQYDRVKFIVARYGRTHDTAPDAVLNRLFAARTSVAPFSLGAKVSASNILDAIQTATSVDLRKEGIHKTDRTPRPSHAATLPDKRLAVVYAIERRSRPVVGPGRCLIEPVEQKFISMIIDPATGDVEARGPAGDVEKAVQQFRHDLERGGELVKLEKLRLTKDEVRNLKEEIGGKLITEAYTPADEATTGIGASSVTLSNRFRSGILSADLSTTPGFQSLPDDRNLNRWLLTFSLEGQAHNVSFNWREGRLVFREGTNEEKVVRYIREAIRRVKTRKREGTNG